MAGNIAQGYAIEVYSWENDADNYNTNTMYGLTLGDAQFYGTMMTLFKRDKFGASFLNDVGGQEKLDSELERVFKSFEDIMTNATWAIWMDILYGGYEQEELTDLLGYPGEQYGCFNDTYYRCAETVTMYFVPQEIEVKEMF
jgi:hypothetical protein